MKSVLSTFLLNQKASLHELITLLDKEFEYASVLGTDTAGTQYNMYRAGSGVSDSDFSERGFVVRVFNGINYSEYSFNNLINVDNIVAKIKEVALTDVKSLQGQDISLMSFPKIEELELHDEFHTEFLIDPFSVNFIELFSRFIRGFETSLLI